MPSRQRIGGIDTLRGIGAVMVVCAHLSFLDELFSSFGMASPFYSAVEMFFIISGFGVAASVLSDSFRLREYAAKRFWRVYPCVIALVALSFVANYGMRTFLPPGAGELFKREPREQFSDALKVLLSLYTVGGNHKSYLFGACWYMSVQAQFYLVIGLFAALFRDSSRRKKALLALSAAVSAVGLAYRVCVAAGLLLSTKGLLYYIISWKADFLFYGVCLQYIYLYIYIYMPIARKGRGSVPGALIARLPAVCIALALVVLIFCGVDNGPENNQALHGIGYLSCALLYSAAILATCFSPRETDRESGRSGRILAWLSSRSYSIYICNFLGLELSWLIIYRFFSWTFYTGSFAHYGIAQTLIGVPGILLSAELMYRYLERPCAQLGRLRLYAIRNRTGIVRLLADRLAGGGSEKI